MEDKTERPPAPPPGKQGMVSRNRRGGATSVGGTVMARSREPGHFVSWAHVAAACLGDVAGSAAHGEVLGEAHPVSVISSVLDEARATQEAAKGKDGGQSAATRGRADGMQADVATGQRAEYQRAEIYSSEYVMVAELKEGGWTDALIRARLGQPDTTRRNPHYTSAAPVRLYSAARVHEAEQAPDWPQALTKAARRRAGGQAATKTKRQRVLDFIAGLTFRVPSLPPEELTVRVCAEYNRRQERAGQRNWREATLASDAAFLRRIEVNFLRHAIGTYNNAVGQTFGRFGVREAYIEINRRAYDAIAAAYPTLAEECGRQALRKGVPWAQNGGPD